METSARRQNERAQQALAAAVTLLLTAGAIALLFLLVTRLSDEAIAGMPTLRVEPAAAAPGSTVVLHGQGAPATAEVHVLVASWHGAGECGSGASLADLFTDDTLRIDTVIARPDGTFQLALEAARIAPTQRGYRYLARVEPGRTRHAPLISRPVCVLFTHDEGGVPSA